ncbi:MAG: hypothetical protein ACD_22C00009G0002 [uncultured bacterium]|nr:MAG: hypothetical protein ACD_22C00009G0002 [uncultured bacterium]
MTNGLGGEKPYILEEPANNVEKNSGSNSQAVISKEGFVVRDPSSLEVVTTINVEEVVRKKPKHTPNLDSFQTISFENERKVFSHLERLSKQRSQKNPAAPKILRNTPDEIDIEYVRGAHGSEMRFGNNIYTAIELAKQIIEAQAFLLRDGVAFLDVKERNYKVDVDDAGRPMGVTFLDFGNAGLVEKGLIVPSSALRIKGYPPEVLREVKKTGSITEHIVDLLEIHDPPRARAAVVYATGNHFRAVLFQPGRFEGSVTKSEKYRLLQRLFEEMAQENPRKRISFKDAYHTLDDLAKDRSGVSGTVGSCVSELDLQILHRKGEINQGKTGEIVIDEKSMEEVFSHLSDYAPPKPKKGI